MSVEIKIKAKLDSSALVQEARISAENVKAAIDRALDNITASVSIAINVESIKAAANKIKKEISSRPVLVRVIPVIKKAEPQPILQQITPRPAIPQPQFQPPSPGITGVIPVPAISAPAAPIAVPTDPYKTSTSSLTQDAASSLTTALTETSQAVRQIDYKTLAEDSVLFSQKLKSLIGSIDTFGDNINDLTTRVILLAAEVMRIQNQISGPQSPMTITQTPRPQLLEPSNKEERDRYGVSNVIANEVKGALGDLSRVIKNQIAELSDSIITELRQAANNLLSSGGRFGNFDDIIKPYTREKGKHNKKKKEFRVFDQELRDVVRRVIEDKLEEPGGKSKKVVRVSDEKTHELLNIVIESIKKIRIVAPGSHTTKDPTAKTKGQSPIVQRFGDSRFGRVAQSLHRIFNSRAITAVSSAVKKMTRVFGIAVSFFSAFSSFVQTVVTPLAIIGGTLAAIRAKLASEAVRAIMAYKEMDAGLISVYETLTAAGYSEKEIVSAARNVVKSGLASQSEAIQILNQAARVFGGVASPAQLADLSSAALKFATIRALPGYTPAQATLDFFRGIATRSRQLTENIGIPESILSATGFSSFDELFTEKGFKAVRGLFNLRGDTERRIKQSLVMPLNALTASINALQAALGGAIARQGVGGEVARWTEAIQSVIKTLDKDPGVIKVVSSLLLRWSSALREMIQVAIETGGSISAALVAGIKALQKHRSAVGEPAFGAPFPAIPSSEFRPAELEAFAPSAALAGEFGISVPRKISKEAEADIASTIPRVAQDIKKLHLILSNMGDLEFLNNPQNTPVLTALLSGKFRPTRPRHGFLTSTAEFVAGKTLSFITSGALGPEDVSRMLHEDVIKIRVTGKEQLEALKKEFKEIKNVTGIDLGRFTSYFERPRPTAFVEIPVSVADVIKSAPTSAAKRLGLPKEKPGTLKDEMTVLKAALQSTQNFLLITETKAGTQRLLDSVKALFEAGEITQQTRDEVLRLVKLYGRKFGPTSTKATKEAAGVVSGVTRDLSVLFDSLVSSTIFRGGSLPISRVKDYLKQINDQMNLVSEINSIGLDKILTAARKKGSFGAGLNTSEIKTMLLGFISDVSDAAALSDMAMQARAAIMGEAIGGLDASILDSYAKFEEFTGSETMAEIGRITVAINAMRDKLDPNVLDELLSIVSDYVAAIPDIISRRYQDVINTGRQKLLTVSRASIEDLRSRFKDVEDAARTLMLIGDDVFIVQGMLITKKREIAALDIQGGVDAYITATKNAIDKVSGAIEVASENIDQATLDVYKKSAFDDFITAIGGSTSTVQEIRDNVRKAEEIGAYLIKSGADAKRVKEAVQKTRAESLMTALDELLSRFGDAAYYSWKNAMQSLTTRMIDALISATEALTGGVEAVLNNVVFDAFIAKRGGVDASGRKIPASTIARQGLIEAAITTGRGVFSALITTPIKNALGRGILRFFKPKDQQSLTAELIEKTKAQITAIMDNTEALWALVSSLGGSVGVTPFGRLGGSPRPPMGLGEGILGLRGLEGIMATGSQNDMRRAFVDSAVKPIADEVRVAAKGVMQQIGRRLAPYLAQGAVEAFAPVATAAMVMIPLAISLAMKDMERPRTPDLVGPPVVKNPERFVTYDNFPKFHSGGTAPSEMIAVLRAGETVIPPYSTSPASRGGGEMKIVVNIGSINTGDKLDPDKIEEVIRDAVSRVGRRGDRFIPRAAITDDSPGNRKVIGV